MSARYLNLKWLPRTCILLVVDQWGRVFFTSGVDHMFDFLEPVRLDGVSKSLHRRLEIADLDLVLVFLVERLERVLGRCVTAANTTPPVTYDLLDSFPVTPRLQIISMSCSAASIFFPLYFKPAIHTFSPGLFSGSSFVASFLRGFVVSIHCSVCYLRQGGCAIVSVCLSVCHTFCHSVCLYAGLL